MAGEEPEDYSKLPLEAKLEHKVWRARLNGYEEATKLFKKIDDEGSSEYSKFTGMIKKFVVDSNQMAQEKGVEAALAFVESASAATRISSDVIAGIVTKCLNGRPKTKEGSIHICLMFVEIEQQEVVLEEILKGFTNKQPKIIAGSAQVIIRILQEFGTKVINMKVLMKAIPALFAHSDKNVRAEAKTMAVELYKWVGAAIKPTLEKNLKPVQLKELEEEWGKLPGTPSVPTRFLRSDQQQEAAAVGVASGRGGDEDGEAGADIVAPVAQVMDPYDFADPEDFLGKMPKDFFEKIADVKWKERKEVLEAVLPTAQSIKLLPGDYGEVMKALKKVIVKDSNVLVVAIAGNIITGLSKGLRNSFQSYASPILAGIFEKFKEKKLNVVTSLREASDAVYNTTSLANIQEEVVEALNSKNPSVKAETLLFLCRCFQQCVPSMIPKPLLKALCPVIVQKLDDTNPTVREAGMECLGTLMRVVGDRPMNSYVENVDKSKMTKIQEHREAVELKIQTGVIPSPMKGKAARPPTPSGPPAPQQPPPGAGGGAAAAKTEVVKKKKKKPPGGDAESAPSAEKAPAKKSAESTVKKTTSSTQPKSSKKGAAGGAKGGAKGKGKGGGASGGVGEAPDPPEPNIANEDVDDKAGALLPSGLLEQLADTKWKDRLEACGKLKEFVSGQAPSDIQCLLCCKVLAKKPGWKDSNFQVMNAKFGVVGTMVEKAKVFGRKSMACVMPGLVDKLGDIKIKATSGETLKLIAERMTLNYVSVQVMKLAFEHKSPKVQSESLEWLGQAIKEFGFLLNIKPFIDFIKKAFGATNPAVRTAAISLLGVIHIYLGPPLRVFFEEEKPALLQQIDTSFEKLAGESPPAPTRGPNAGGEEEEEEDEEEGGGGGGGGGGAAQAPVSIADLMPKVDISGQIKPDLITDLGDKNWKIRGEGLQKVTEIVKAAKFIEPNLGDLPGALKGRLGDSNKNLVITTLNIVTSLASSMGSSSSRHSKVLVPAVIATFSDSKPQVRVAAVSCLNAWYTELGMAQMVEQEFLTSSLATENPNLRAELLNWLEEKLPSAGKLPSEFSTIVPPLFSCVEDRSGEVRKKAQAALPHIMAHVGYENMSRQCAKLGQASKQTVKALLDKHKASVAPPPKAKQAPAKVAEEPAPKKASKHKPGKAEVKEEVVEVEEEVVVEKKAKTSEKKSSAKKGTGKSATKGAKATKKGGAVEDAGAPLVCIPSGKENRSRDEERMKTLKWNFNQPRKEHVEQLHDQLQPCVSATLFSQLFHDDFKKHIEALGTLTKCVSGDAPLKDAAVGTVDLLLRWVTLRFFDTNTTVNLKCLAFLKALFEMLVKEDTYRMSDYEANAFLPYLVNKVGDAKEPVRKGVRALFREMCSFYAPAKLFVFVMDGLKSKNARQRAECLEELGILIQNNGMIVCGSQPQKSLPIVAAQISDRDNTVRSAALNTMVTVYGNTGEAVYKFTSQLSQKDVSLLEERIKRSGKKPSSASISSASTATTATTTSASAKTAASSTETKSTETKSTRSKSTSSESASSAQTSVDDKPAIAEVKSEELEPPPPPAPVEPQRPGTVPGPFKMNFDFAKMRKDMEARSERSLGFKMELEKEELALLDQNPVEMPKLISKYMNPSYPINLSPTRMASTSAAINYIISQITSSDIAVSSKAIRQIESTMVNPSQRAAIHSHVDHLIRTVLMQMRVNFYAPLSNTEDKEALKQVMDLGKLLTSCLFTLFCEKSLAELACKDSLSEVERDIMGYLVDEKLLKLEDAPQFIRSFNSLMLRMCENCNKTAILGSLIHVLLGSINTDGSSTKVTELTMKCLWKLTRQIPQFITTVNLDQLLLEIHQFMVGYLGVVSSPSPEDTPFRTIKTILFHVTNILGAKILDHLSLIKDSNRSKVTIYIRKTLAKQKGEGSSPAPSNQVGGNDSGRKRTSMKESKVTKILSALPAGSSSVLSDIFLKIGEPDKTKEGLNELYQFRTSHPTFDLDSVLAGQTKFYREYILRGLRTVETGVAIRSNYEKQKEVLEKMKEDASKTFGISMEELRSGPRSPSHGVGGTEGGTSERVEPKQDENKPINRPTISKPRSLKAPSSSSSGTRGGGAGTSSVDLADLRRRLDKLKGTT